MFPIKNFSFESKKLLELYTNIEEFRIVVDSGNYVFVDGFLVINSPEYVYYKNGLHLKSTKTARRENFCLYQESICGEKEIDVPVQVEIGDGLHAIALKKEKVVFALSTSYKGAKKAFSVSDITMENANIIFGGDFPPNDDFNTLIKKIIADRGITYGNLSELTGVSEKTISRICTSDYHPSLETVIALCVGLDIDPYNSINLIHLAGYNLTNSKRDKAYRFIINCAYCETVYNCNRMLERLGFQKTLSNL